MARTVDEQTPEPADGRPTLAQLARLIVARRAELPNPVKPGQTGPSQKSAARAGGMSVVTWNNIEQGRPVQRGSYFGVEDALGWARGSIGAWLAGEGPEPGRAPLAPVDDRAPIRDALRRARHRELLDELATRLLQLDSDEDDTGPLVEQRRHLAASSGATETVESVEARGGRAGLPLDETTDGGTGVAEGGQA